MKASANATAPRARHAKPASGTRRAAKVRARGAGRTAKAGVARLKFHFKPLAARLSGAFKRVRGKVAGRPRRPRNPANTRTALWLWCFPVGLSLMWRAGCTWRRGVKIGISAAMVAILAAILLVPVPRVDARTSGVEVVADKPAVEVYGPALPRLIVPGYTRENTGSIIVDEVKTDAHYVYAADGARCYHEYECKFAFASSQRLTVYEAYYLGFEPCGRCKPPVYTPGVTDPITADVIGADEAADPADSASADAAA